MAAGTEMGRLLVWRAGWLKNQGLRNTRETSLAKWHATEHAVQSALDAIQVHGANGYSNEFPVERYLRNSKAAVIYEGTSQLHTLIQADYALGYREDRPLRCEPWPAPGLGTPERLRPVDADEALDRGRARDARRARGDVRPRRRRSPGGRSPPTRSSAAADPEQISQLRLVLRLMESRAANLALTGKAARFRDLSPVARERYLLGWARLVARAQAIGVPRVPQAPDVPRLRRPRDLRRGQPAAGRDRLPAGRPAGDVAAHGRPRRRISRRRPARTTVARGRRRGRRVGGGRRSRRRGAGAGRPVRRRARGGTVRSTRRGCRATSSTHSTACTSTTGS